MATGRRGVFLLAGLVGACTAPPAERLAAGTSRVEQGGEVVVYFHGQGRRGTVSASDGVVAPLWEGSTDRMGNAARLVGGRTVRAVAGYSLGRNPMAAFLRDPIASSADTILLIDPLYAAPVTARANTLLVCSRDVRAVASCDAIAASLGVTPCIFEGSHEAIAARIAGFLAWRGGGCPSGTSAATGPMKGTPPRGAALPASAESDAPPELDPGATATEPPSLAPSEPSTDPAVEASDVDLADPPDE